MADTALPVVPGDRGLDDGQVAERVARGDVNITTRRTSRSVGEIVRANVFTRFNAIITVLATVILVVGSPIDALFAFLMVINSAIGIVQEVRAKRTLDRLNLLLAPTIVVVRNGVDVELAASDLVVDDLLQLRSGDQVPVDGRVTSSSGLEVDESALTGESEPVAKRVGDEVRSGSFVVAGSGSVVATQVGADAWIERLVDEARQFVITRSELRDGVDGILRVISWIIGPLAALSLWSQLRSDRDVEDALVSSVASVVGLVPQGLVLLVSMAMAVAIIRLAKGKVVVQELYAVEGLARVDVLCVDKTGTLTTGQFEVEEITALDGNDAALSAGLGALVAHESSPTSSSRVLVEVLDRPDGWVPAQQVAFSSARKWSATTFEERGTWVLGAPDVLFDAMSDVEGAHRATVSAATGEGLRVLLVAWSAAVLTDQVALPVDLRAVGYVVLREQLREDAAEIMGYFARQNVAVKIISGDNAETVSAVGRRLGIDGAERHTDLRKVAVAEADLDATTVFGRVAPEQKRDLVAALQDAGHVVAMTGDGVNDIPALKRADIGIAMNTATPATRSISQVVLLDGRFDRLPEVVAEGRRVIANMERVSALFVTKTVYAAAFAVVIGLWGTAFPFLPRHMSLVSELTIGVPAFALSFRSADRPYRPGYLRRVLRFAVPLGLATAAVTLVGYWLLRIPPVDAELAEARTAATCILLAVAFWVLYLLMRPVDRYDALVLCGLAVLTVIALATPFGRTFYAIEWPGREASVLLVAYAIGSVAVLNVVTTVVRRHLPAHDG